MSMTEAMQDTSQQTLPADSKFDDGNAGANDNQQAGDPRQEAKKPEAKDEEKKKVRPSKLAASWPLVLAGLVVVGFVGVVLWDIFRPRPDVWTNDAYVSVHYATIAPRISGQVSTVPVDDNQVVKNGQVLVTLDPRDYETAVSAAEAALARDTAQVSDVAANLARQTPIIQEQESNVTAAQARLTLAKADAHRFGNLAVSGAGTVQQRQQADATLQQSQAQLDGAQASLDAARRQMDVIKAQLEATRATVESDKAQLRQAKLNLSYTQILSPVDGMVTERSVQVGNTVAPGTTLMTVVPLEEVYIVANYREVDLTHVRPGQRATIHVDAYNIDLSGTVNNIAAASGISFAPIQPNNATGNFTKIVQRLPVKIVVDRDQPLARLLRVGLSVETTIHTGLADVVDQQRRAQSHATER